MKDTIKSAIKDPILILYTIGSIYLCYAHYMAVSTGSNIFGIYVRGTQRPSGPTAHYHK